MVFFKFYKSDNLSFLMLRHGEVYFASPPELNDSDESNVEWIFKGNPKSWVKFSEYILSKGTSARRESGSDPTLVARAREIGGFLKRKAGRSSLKFQDLDGLIDEAIEALRNKPELEISENECNDIKKFIASKLLEGIENMKYTVSFCLDATKPLMWAYYADAEKGFALILESPDQKLSIESDVRVLGDTKTFDGGRRFEFGSYKDCVIPLRQIVYRDGVVKVNALDELSERFRYSDEEFGGGLFENPLPDEKHLLGLVKSTEWKHECELRGIFPNKPVPWSSGLIDKDLRSVRVGSKHIRGVIFGYQMNETDQNRALTCLRALASRLEDSSGDSEEVIFYIFKAIKGASRVTREISPRGVLGPPRNTFHNGFLSGEDLSDDQRKGLQRMALEINGSSPGKKKLKTSG